MKVKYGFVSNSSTLNSIVAWDRKKKGPEKTMEIAEAAFEFDGEEYAEVWHTSSIRKIDQTLKELLDTVFYKENAEKAIDEIKKEIESGNRVMLISTKREHDKLREMIFEEVDKVIWSWE